MLYIAYLVLALSAVNLARVALFMLASDLFDIRANLGTRSPRAKVLKDAKKTDAGAYIPEYDGRIVRPGFTKKAAKKSRYTYRPLVSIIVPAHNEEKTLRRNLESIANSTYKNVELIIVNDSSTDLTPKIARQFKQAHKDSFKKIKILNVNVRGKAKALNAGLEHAHGKLFMCLDADSALSERALEYGVEEFRNRKLAALCSNVKIFPGKGGLNLFQRLEYLICYQMKKAESLADTQYIVGGIGSMFRTDLVRKLGKYDTDTITEDIDLSMKIIAAFGKQKRIGYTPRMVVYTEAVTDIKGLLQQRYRWKYGRYQVFLKQKSLFWSRSKKHNRLLTWVYLPYALYAELAYALEPMVFLFVFYILFRYHSAAMIVSSLAVFIFYTTIQVTGATAGYSVKERLKFLAVAPLAFFGMYILSFVEYVATVRGLMNSRKIIDSYKNGVGNCDWQHVSRSGLAEIKN